MVLRLVSAFIFLVFSSTAVQAEDVKGSADHPEVGRFAGSTILGYKHYNFNEYLFPEGDRVKDENGDWKLSKGSEIEGEVTRIYYVAPKEASVAEVMRNYRINLERKGYKEVYKCKGDTYECGSLFVSMDNYKPGLVKYPYKMSENRFASFKKEDSEGNKYVTLLVFNYGFEYYSSRFNHPIAEIHVVEEEPLDDEQIEVITADKITQAVAETGRIALYGIYFDTDKATIKPESTEALVQIHKALVDNPNLKLHVVGHTDNTGSFDHNMKLSKARANAVVATLVKRGISADRLKPNGVASLAPVASNTDEAGRAKNRRVELVAR